MDSWDGWTPLDFTNTNSVVMTQCISLPSMVSITAQVNEKDYYYYGGSQEEEIPNTKYQIPNSTEGLNITAEAKRKKYQIPNTKKCISHVLVMN